MDRDQLLSRITIDPNIFRSKPIIRGMRIKVENVLALLEQGVTTEKILDDYPDLEIDDIYACIVYKTEEHKMQIDPIKYAMNRAYQFVEEQQEALDEGSITEAQWFDINKEYFTNAYLSSDNPRAQSGHGGDETRWRYSRGMLIEAIHKSGTFLDIGCANGYLMESLHRWLAGSGLEVEFYGLDISEGLAELAKKRFPHWQDRIYIGNALYWIPPVKYDFVRTGLEYVPLGRQKDFVNHLLINYVAQGGRLIIGLYSEERDKRELESQIHDWGYNPTGYCEKSKPDNEIVSYKMLWIDKD